MIDGFRKVTAKTTSKETAELTSEDANTIVSNKINVTNDYSYDNVVSVVTIISKVQSGKILSK